MPEVQEMSAIAVMVKALTQSDNPVAAWLLLLFLILALTVVGVPLVSRSIKAWKEANASGKIDDARAELFEQLQKTVEQNAKDIRKLIDEKNVYVEQNLKLRGKIMGLEQKIRELVAFEETVKVLKDRLREKDELIGTLREDIRRREEYERNRNEVIDELKDKLHKLELRLQQDEVDWCRDCAFKSKPGAGGLAQDGYTGPATA